MSSSICTLRQRRKHCRAKCSKNFSYLRKSLSNTRPGSFSGLSPVWVEPLRPTLLVSLVLCIPLSALTKAGPVPEHPPGVTSAGPQKPLSHPGRGMTRSVAVLMLESVLSTGPDEGHEQPHTGDGNGTPLEARVRPSSVSLSK